jgi:hypothetical protein
LHPPGVVGHPNGQSLFFEIATRAWMAPMFMEAAPGTTDQSVPFPPPKRTDFRVGLSPSTAQASLEIASTTERAAGPFTPLDPTTVFPGHCTPVTRMCGAEKEDLRDTRHRERLPCPRLLGVWG